MEINSKVRKIRSLKRGDPQFHIFSGGTMYPRASLQIPNICPPETQLLLAEAIEKGWIEVIAWVPEDQLLWDKLKGNP